jgi:hypothetical protein
MTRKISLPLLCAIAVLVSRLAGAAPTLSKGNWSPCYKTFGPFQCGTVQVPLDHDNPTGAAISLAAAPGRESRTSWLPPLLHSLPRCLWAVSRVCVVSGLDTKGGAR